MRYSIFLLNDLSLQLYNKSKGIILWNITPKIGKFNCSLTFCKLIALEVNVPCGKCIKTKQLNWPHFGLVKFWASSFAWPLSRLAMSLSVCLLVSLSVWLFVCLSLLAAHLIWFWLRELCTRCNSCRHGDSDSNNNDNKNTNYVCLLCVFICIHNKVKLQIENCRRCAKKIKQNITFIHQSSTVHPVHLDLCIRASPCPKKEWEKDWKLLYIESLCTQNNIQTWTEADASVISV